MIFCFCIFMTFGIIIVFFVSVYAFYKCMFQYWKNRKLPYLEPKIPFGICASPFLGKENWAFTMARCYKEMKKQGWKHGGLYFFASPKYLPLDLDYLRNILSKDFQYFTDRAVYYHEKKDILNAHLVNLTGTRWKNLRIKLNPTFSSGKMKTMFKTLEVCQTPLINKMNENCEVPVDIKEISACFTTDVIGTCMFGLDCKSFERDNSPFRVFGKKVFAITHSLHLKKFFGLNFPKLAHLLNFCITSQEIVDFYLKVARDTVSYREKNKVSRNDFLQLLMELKNSNEATFTVENIAAQCYSFFVAGFETSSTLMSFTLYEIARNPQIQQNVRREIETVLKKHGDITYDSIKEMKYLHQVIEETLRMYPPIPLINRRCAKDYKIPDEDIIIEKGTIVLLPVLAIHYDEDYYPHPEKFDPDRFSEENKSQIPKYAYLPFGKGPRICIAKQFGLIQAKVGLSCLLKHFKFTVNSKTKHPLKMKTRGLILSTVDPIWLDVSKV